MMLPISDTFIRTITNLYGDRGSAWIQNLPGLIADCTQRWSLNIQEPLTNPTYSVVIPAIRTDPDQQVVLKLTVPNPELFCEIEALRLYDGQGAVRLLEADYDRGALLLERLTPGEPLLSLENDYLATSIVCQVMQQLWRPVPTDHPFTTTANWGKGFQRLRARFRGQTGPFPELMVTKAEEIFDDFQRSADTPVLLHGDLHHWNVLSAGRAPWLAIDPKGVVGEPAYDAGAFIRNPYPELVSIPHAKRVILRRIDLFEELLGFDRQRIAGWSFAQAVLSAWWSYEDHDQKWEIWLACADLLIDLD